MCFIVKRKWVQNIKNNIVVVFYDQLLYTALICFCQALGSHISQNGLCESIQVIVYPTTKRFTHKLAFPLLHIVCLAQLMIVACIDGFSCCLFTVKLVWRGRAGSGLEGRGRGCSAQRWGRGSSSLSHFLCADRARNGERERGKKKTLAHSFSDQLSPHSQLPFSPFLLCDGLADRMAFIDMRVGVWLHRTFQKILPFFVYSIGGGH